MYTQICSAWFADNANTREGKEMDIVEMNVYDILQSSNAQLLPQFFTANSKSVPHLLTQCITITLMKDLPEQPRPFFETTHYQNNILSCSPSREFFSYSLYSIKVDPFSRSPLLDGFYWIMVVPVKCHTFVVKGSTVPSLIS